MFNIILSLVFLIGGAVTIYFGYKASKTKEVKSHINKIINPAMIKNKEQYIKTFCKWNYILGGIAILEGIVGLTSCYISKIGFAFDVLNLILIGVLFIYMFKIVSALCKS